VIWFVEVIEAIWLAVHNGFAGMDEPGPDDEDREE
jgi:hypothetical protein